MPCYKLRTLLIVLALGPPVLAGMWFAIYGLAGILKGEDWRGVVLLVTAVVSAAVLASWLRDAISGEPAN